MIQMRGTFLRNCTVQIFITQGTPEFKTEIKNLHMHSDIQIYKCM